MSRGPAQRSVPAAHPDRAEAAGPAAGKRADVALVEAGLFESRAKAREAIEAGLVTVDGIILRKPSAPVRPESRLEAEAAYPWVSRGGVKLAAGLDAFAIDPAGRVCLDVGASTGGFSDVLLARGAAHVTAIDVGHAQFHPRLAVDPRLTLLEGLDARALQGTHLPRSPTLVACDVSFIGLRLVLPNVLSLAAPQAELLALVKPQFEAGFERVKKGIVRDPTVHAEVCETVQRQVVALGWRVLGCIPSPIEGQDGNREFLLGARR